MSASNPLDPVPLELRKIDGIEKLRRNIDRELKSPNFESKSSNLPHLLSILKCVRDLPEIPSAVLKPFSYSGGKSGRIIVDIVSSNSWYKVSARNPKALNLLAAGGGNFGQKSIVDHVQDYLDCAKDNPCVFRVPKVKVIFTSGISVSLAKELETLGAFVEGIRIPDSELQERPRIKVYQDSSNLKDFQDQPAKFDKALAEIDDDSFVRNYKNPSLDGVTKLNLDITAFLVLVSNLTNGHSNVSFSKKILSDQAQAEGKRPQKTILDTIFHNRQLFCCETALKEFQIILSTVGGEEERKRAEEFLKKVTVVPDKPTQRVLSLYVSGNIKKRSLVIFGTGDFLEAVTVTANIGFVRSAKTQGVNLAAFIHESRALTEQKENLVKQGLQS